MKSFLQLSVIIFSLFFTTAVFGQSEKTIEKANAEIEKLDSKLMSAGAEFKLTETQKEEMLPVYAEGFEKMQENWKAKISKEEKRELNKPIRKEMNKTVRKEILTKEQGKALSSLNKKK